MKEKFSTLLSLNAIDMLSASIVPSNTISDQKGSCNSKTGQCVLYQCNKTGQQIQQTLLETKSAHFPVLQSCTDCAKLPQAYTTQMSIKTHTPPAVAWRDSTRKSIAWYDGTRLLYLAAEAFSGTNLPCSCICCNFSCNPSTASLAKFPIKKPMKNWKYLQAATACHVCIRTISLL